MSLDDLHELKVRITEASFRVLQGMEKQDGISSSERIRDVMNAWAENKIHESTLILRALEGEEPKGTQRAKS